MPYSSLGRSGIRFSRGFSDRGDEMKEKSNSHVYKATTCELKENICWSNMAMRIQQNEKHFSNRSNIIQFKFRS